MYLRSLKSNTSSHRQTELEISHVNNGVDSSKTHLEKTHSIATYKSTVQEKNTITQAISRMYLHGACGSERWPHNTDWKSSQCIDWSENS